MRTCAATECSKPIIRRHGESLKEMENRKTCCRDCHQALIRAEKFAILPASKTCLRCKNDFGPRETDQPHEYARRMFCDNCCRKGRGRRHEKRDRIAPRVGETRELHGQLWRRLANAGETVYGMKMAGLSLDEIAMALALQKGMRV